MEATMVAVAQRVIHIRRKHWVSLALVVIAASAANSEWYGSLPNASTAARFSPTVALPLSRSEVPAGFRVRNWMPVPRDSLSGALEGYTTTLIGVGTGNRITYLRFATAAEGRAYLADVGGKLTSGGEPGREATCIQEKSQCLAAFGPVVVSGSSHSQCHGAMDGAALARARTLLRAGAAHLRQSV